MGVEVQLEEHKGPVLPKTISTEADINNLHTKNAEDELHYVYSALKLTKKALNNRVPLIGFAGAPFTILCYMVEGKGSKTFDKAKQFCFTETALAHSLLQKIAALTIAYLKKQVEAGADCVQVFDSWSGLLSPDDFTSIALPYLKQISDALSPICPVILFPKGSHYAIPQIAATSASAIGLDWCTTPQQARKLAGDNITLQGNFDPTKLLMSPAEIKKEVKKMIDAFGVQRYIANLWAWHFASCSG